jgi:hypothetical protein
MKTILIFAISMLVTVFAFAQNQDVEEVKVTPPLFTGIQNAIQSEAESATTLIKNYLKDNINYPVKAKLCKREGTEVVQFTVTVKGKVTDFKIINSVCPEIDNEIVWALQNTNGMWLPGYNNGKPVDMTKEVTLAFCLEDFSKKPIGEIFKEKATTYFISANTALFEKKNIKKALRFYCASVNYLPYDKSSLLMRGMCRYELGDNEGAKEDWNRMASLGGTVDLSEYFAQIKGMKGYYEMMATIRK